MPPRTRAAAREKEIDSAVMNVRRMIDRGQRQQALDLLGQHLMTYQNAPKLQAQLTEMVNSAQRDADRARVDALRARAAERAVPELQRADNTLRESAQLRQRNRQMDAARSYWRAQDQFAEAGRLAATRPATLPTDTRSPSTRRRTISHLNAAAAVQPPPTTQQNPPVTPRQGSAARAGEARAAAGAPRAAGAGETRDAAAAGAGHRQPRRDPAGAEPLCRRARVTQRRAGRERLAHDEPAADPEPRQRLPRAEQPHRVAVQLLDQGLRRSRHRAVHAPPRRSPSRTASASTAPTPPRSSWKSAATTGSSTTSTPATTRDAIRGDRVDYEMSARMTPPIERASGAMRCAAKPAVNMKITRMISGDPRAAEDRAGPVADVFLAQAAIRGGDERRVERDFGEQQRRDVDHVEHAHDAAGRREDRDHDEDARRPDRASTSHPLPASLATDDASRTDATFSTGSGIQVAPPPPPPLLPPANDFSASAPRPAPRAAISASRPRRTDWGCRRMSLRLPSHGGSQSSHESARRTPGSRRSTRTRSGAAIESMPADRPTNDVRNAAPPANARMIKIVSRGDPVRVRRSRISETSASRVAMLTRIPQCLCHQGREGQAGSSV